MSIINKIWNNKTFEAICEGYYDTMQFIGEGLVFLLDCTTEAFSGSSSSSNNSSTSSCANSCTPSRSVEEETYEYWKGLSYREQQDYFELNYKLQEYGENYRYDNNEQMAKSVAEIARRENRSFTDKYDRY